MPSPAWLTALCRVLQRLQPPVLLGLFIFQEHQTAQCSISQACAELTLGTATAQPPGGQVTAVDQLSKALHCSSRLCCGHSGISAPRSRSRWLGGNTGPKCGQSAGGFRAKHLQRAPRENFSPAERVLSTPGSLRLQVEHLLVALCKVGSGICGGEWGSPQCRDNSKGAPHSAGTTGSKLSLVPALPQTLAK